MRDIKESSPLKGCRLFFFMRDIKKKTIIFANSSFFRDWKNDWAWKWLGVKKWLGIKTTIWTWMSLRLSFRLQKVRIYIPTSSWKSGVLSKQVLVRMFHLVCMFVSVLNATYGDRLYFISVWKWVHSSTSLLASYSSPLSSILTSSEVHVYCNTLWIHLSFLCPSFDLLTQLLNDFMTPSWNIESVKKKVTP